MDSLIDQIKSYENQETGLSKKEIGKRRKNVNELKTKLEEYKDESYKSGY